MKPKILVTGADGFIGSHLLYLLRGKSYPLKVLLLPHHQLKNPYRFSETLEDSRIEIVYGNISNLADVRRAVQDCDWVFHLAAISQLWVKNKKIYQEVNVKGTENIIRASLECGVKKLVYTSSCEVFDRDEILPATEDNLYSIDKAKGAYTRSKLKCEAMIRKISSQIFSVIVHPSMPIGPGDSAPTPVGEMIRMFLNSPPPALYESGFNLVDVEDVALGHYLAALQGRSGENYILSGENLSIRNFLEKLNRIQSFSIPKIKIPYSLAYLSTLLMEGFSKISGKKPLSNLEGLRSIRKPYYFDNFKACSELGWRARPIDEALKKAVYYYKEWN